MTEKFPPRRHFSKKHQEHEAAEGWLNPDKNQFPDDDMCISIAEHEALLREALIKEVEMAMKMIEHAHLSMSIPVAEVLEDLRSRIAVIREGK